MRNNQVVIERPDGTRLQILANLEPLRDEAGELIGGVNCFQDTTEVTKALDDLRQQEQIRRALVGELKIQCSNACNSLSSGRFKSETAQFVIPSAVHTIPW